MTSAFTVQMTRNMGGDSPMCVFRKTFTRLALSPMLQMLDSMTNQLRIDNQFLRGEKWDSIPIGSTVRIRTPQRFIGSGPQGIV